jgi:hypothetical protein
LLVGVVTGIEISIVVDPIAEDEKRDEGKDLPILTTRESLRRGLREPMLQVLKSDARR